MIVLLLALLISLHPLSIILSRLSGSHLFGFVLVLSRSFRFSPLGLFSHWHAVYADVCAPVPLVSVHLSSSWLFTILSMAWGLRHCFRAGSRFLCRSLLSPYLNSRFQDLTC